MPLSPGSNIDVQLRKEKDLGTVRFTPRPMEIFKVQFWNQL